MKHLADISNGQTRLVVEPFMAKTYTGPNEEGYYYLYARFYNDLNSSEPNVDWGAVSVELEPLEDQSEDILILYDDVGNEVHSFYPAAQTMGGEPGFRIVRFNTKTAGSQTKTQKIKITGRNLYTHEEFPLYREVEITLQKKQTMTVMLKYDYAAPEQYGGHGQTDARTDIYCLGATMYHLVTGHNPSTPPYEMYPIRQWNPMLSSGLEEIIIKCTQRNPNDRYQSCAELLYALDHYQDLDIENKKVQNFKWNTFIASVILTLAMLVGTFGFSIATSAMTSQTYSQLVKEADEISDGLKADYESTMQKPDAGKVAEAESKLVKAITDVDPANCDAYISLMNLYMANGKLESTESSNLQKYISLNEDQIRSRDEKKYINELVCPLADNLFFCFNTTDKTGQIFSAKWYGKAADSDLTENKKRVEILSKLSANSKNEDAMDEKGDSAISTSEYWSLLQDLIKSESLSDTNIKIKLLIYRFAVNRLSEKTESWRTAVGGDISEQRYFETLDFIEQQVNEITSTELYKNNPSLERYVEDIKDVIEVSRATGFGYKVTGAVNTQEGAR